MKNTRERIFQKNAIRKAQRNAGVPINLFECFPELTLAKEKTNARIISCETQTKITAIMKGVCCVTAITEL